MSDFFQLGFDGSIDLRDTVAVDITPEAGNAVEIAVAVAVDQMHSLGGGDDQRIGIEPKAHRSEGMPDVLLVKLAELAGVHHGWSQWVMESTPAGVACGSVPRGGFL